MKNFAVALMAAFAFTACSSSDDDDSPATPKDNAPKGVEAVDLGLTVKWANMNLGATTPEGFGYHYAWAEVEPKLDLKFTNSNNKYFEYDNGSGKYLITKYCLQAGIGMNDFTDGKYVLELDDDAAHVNWQGKWRMPTKAEMSDLIEKCTWTWKQLKGTNGYEVKGKNGNTIFLPAAGICMEAGSFDATTNGAYMTNTAMENSGYATYYLHFKDGSKNLSTMPRYHGFTVRPVCQ